MIGKLKYKYLLTILIRGVNKCLITYRYFDAVDQIPVCFGVFIAVIRSPSEFLEQNLGSVGCLAFLTKHNKDECELNITQPSRQS